jgi:transposase
MLEALMAGQRDPKVLAELARGGCAASGPLVAALTGRFDDHHAELARMLLDHIDALGIQIDRLTSRIQELIGAIPAAQPPGTAPDLLAQALRRPPPAPRTPTSPLLPPPQPDPAVGAATPGRGPRHRRQGRPGALIAELGLDMGQFPTPGQLVSWARLAPRTIQSGAKRRAGTTGKANPYLKGVLGERSRRGRQDRHLPRRALPPPGPAHRQAQGPGRHRPVHPGDRLAPTGRPHRPLL